MKAGPSGLNDHAAAGCPEWAHYGRGQDALRELPAVLIGARE